VTTPLGGTASREPPGSRRGHLPQWLPWWLPGALALTAVAALTVLPLGAMLREAGALDPRALLDDPWIGRVVRFSLVQAALSTALSVGLALPVALALSHEPRFPGRGALVTLFSLSLVIPTIVAIFGIVAVYGRSGWLNTALDTIGLGPLPLYGLPGILVAHVFFNMPLAARVLLQSLEGVPGNEWRLAAQLGMRPLDRLRLIEWPSVRAPLVGVSVLIFTLCFTSFAIVMTLGGGPRATTIEVAIYQALRFDFDLPLAVALALVQLALCVLLMLASTFAPSESGLGFSAPGSSSRTHPGPDSGSDADDGVQRILASIRERLLGTRRASRPRRERWRPAAPPWRRIANAAVIALAAAFVLLPLVALLVSALNPKTLAVLSDAATLRATRDSVLAALATAVLALALALGLLSATRRLRVRLGQERAGRWLQLSGNVILVLPPVVLGTGLFLLLRPWADVFSIALVLVVAINALMALPFVLRVLDAPMMRTAHEHDCLLQSLGIRGWNRWRLIDWPVLRRPVGLALAMAATLSAGDLSAIALFGSERVRTLPLLLYQRMGSYRLEEAAVTAGLLLLLCLVLFATLQRFVGEGFRARDR